MLEAAFFSLTAHTIDSTSSFFIERYAQGGMSSGHISPEFWKEEGLNILITRYLSMKNLM
jgi:molybdenum cofactor cytidylyltransferase